MHSVIDRYVLLVSDHNLAEYRACLRFKPAHISLIVTQRMDVVAQRLERVLRQALPDSQVERIGSTVQIKLDGERAETTMHWIERCFQPHSAAWHEQRVAFNMTGGTKLLSVLLGRAYPWQEVHYQPHQPNQARLWMDCFVPDQTGQLQVSTPIELTDIQPSLASVVELYVQPPKVHTANPIFLQSDSQALALLRLQAQQLDAPNDDNLWPVLTPILNRIWYEQAATGKTIGVAWSEFAVAQAALRIWFKRLNRLLPTNTPAVTWDDQQVFFPTVSNKQLKDWRRWISGDWYEQLIAAWLLESGVPAHFLQAGVQIIPDQSQGRESDLLLMHKHQLHVIEIKSDLPPNTALSALEAQVSSSAQSLGKIIKVLVVSPAIRAKAKPAAWSEFAKHCTDHRVELIEAGQAADLKRLLR
jgi:hypothetical protein